MLASLAASSALIRWGIRVMARGDGQRNESKDAAHASRGFTRELGLDLVRLAALLITAFLVER